MLQVMGVREDEVLNPASHPMGTLGLNFPADVLSGDSPLVAQGFNYYDFQFKDLQEWLETRCSVDFSVGTLKRAWDFAGPLGPLKGQPFFAMHARLEDFASAFPGEDTSPPLEDYTLFAVLLAKRAGLQRIFIATNGEEKEKQKMLATIQSSGLEGHLLPLENNHDDNYLASKYIDAAIAGYATAFMGNKISTYSYLIAGQLICAGRGANVTFFRAKDFALANPLLQNSEPPPEELNATTRA